MIQNTFSDLWAAMAPALGDHLWQSTLFAAACGMLTLAMRKNHARTRYALWLAASIKFLVPFSWLVALGSRFSWLRAATPSTSGVYFTVEEVSQPFTQHGASVITAAPAVSLTFTHWLPALLAFAWLAGFVGVVLLWCLRWRRISAEIRTAVPVVEGREVEALRRAQQFTGLRKRVELLVSRATLEPGIFGLSRPVLVWPEGISQHLENAHMEAILAHELWHVRRRDNLAAAIHMAVQATFWFHPLVWWLGARLVDERERACDEQVVELGSERQVYAESILKVCEFCVGSPLACVSGVTGADLKKRMVHIMSHHVVRKLDFSRKLLLSAVAVLAIAAPVVFGLVKATPGLAESSAVSTPAPASSFESVSIKPSAFSDDNRPNHKVMRIKMMHSPDGFVAENITLKALIQEAYGVQPNQIAGGPEWLDSATYDVNAKVDKSEMDKISPKQRIAESQRLLQAVLADRTRLALHSETKVLPGYTLLIDEGGSKLQLSKNQDEPKEQTDLRPAGGSMEGARIVADHKMMMKLRDDRVVALSAGGITSDEFARLLSRHLGIAVENQTGLKGNYEFNLQWTDPNPEAKDTDADANAADGAKAPDSLVNAIRDQLGLKLVPQQRPMQVLVIDNIEKPSQD
jgi:bla regulator protein blaR1